MLGCLPISPEWILSACSPAPPSDCCHPVPGRTMGSIGRVGVGRVCPVASQSGDRVATICTLDWQRHGAFSRGGKPITHPSSGAKRGLARRPQYPWGHLPTGTRVTGLWEGKKSWSVSPPYPGESKLGRWLVGGDPAASGPRMSACQVMAGPWAPGSALAPKYLRARESTTLNI